MNNFTKNVLQSYITDSNEAVEFKLVKTPSDIIDESASFKPEMSHQIFGDSEQIFGYRGLKIKLYYSASRLTTYLSHTYDEKVNPDEFEGVKPDEVIKPIAEKIPPGYLSNIDDFTQALENDATFKPYGEMIHRISTDPENNGNVRTFEIFFNDISAKGFANFHERLQTFLLWYIDASSYIDTDDERWRFFVVYEKSIENGYTHYAVAGYTTVYEYYAYPCHIRPRISQMIVLPPFQRIRLGAHMLETVYTHYREQKNVLDITVEDPSENFQRLRDFIDTKNCLRLEGLSLGNMELLENNVVLQIQKELKLNKKQIRRVFEILKLQKVNKHDEEQYKQYRLLIKNRLNSHFRKEDSDMNKLKKVLSAEELAASLSVTGKEQRMETLEKLYRAVEEDYDYIVQKLNNNPC